MIGFHKVLISVAVVFCAGFAIYEWQDYQAVGGSLSLGLAIAFLIADIALGYYLAHLNRFLYGKRNTEVRDHMRERNGSVHS